MKSIQRNCERKDPFLYEEVERAGGRLIYPRSEVYLPLFVDCDADDPNNIPTGLDILKKLNKETT